MEYTKDNIIGLHLRHKDYEINNIHGHYIVVQNGLLFNSSSSGKREFSAYTSQQIIDNIKDGTWIITLNNNNYYFY